MAEQITSVPEISKKIVLKDANGNYVEPYVNKQDPLTAGESIDITNNVISVSPIVSFMEWEEA